VVAAGTSTIATNPPVASVRIPPTGIPDAPPIVKVAAVVLGGKLLPVNVMSEPVEAEVGDIVIVPLGIETLMVLELFKRFSWGAPTNAAVCMVPALSVTVTILVPARASVGIVTVPTPVPSDPIGKVTVPTKVTVETPTVNVAPVLVGETAKPATVIVRAPPGLTEVGEAVIDLAVRVKSVPDTPTNGPPEAGRVPSVAVKTIVELHALHATSASVGIVVA
jgi:hypothetical protein